MGGAIGCCLGHHRAGQAPVPVLKDLWGNLSLWSKPSCPWGQGESREAGKPCLSLARPVGLAALLFLRRLVTAPQNAVRGTNSSDEARESQKRSRKAAKTPENGPFPPKTPICALFGPFLPPEPEARRNPLPPGPSRSGSKALVAPFPRSWAALRHSWGSPRDASKPSPSLRVISRVPRN